MVMPFNTQLLDEALAERQENHEQERRKVLQQVLEWLQRSGDQYEIHRAYLFGSVTQPMRFHEGSDVDLAVETVDSVKQIEAIADLSMVLLRDVDIVNLRHCHFADRIRERGLLWTRDS
ncbi:MAG: nucleotidyltransferase domain-containing protein [Drouetiella hepatica Uher 2000/2452]|jgi:hypothetical protein|uniref:Nucleotidyltransferase domain-containing protein n=1 Tax=Drouetiella hepatica Uher 2000/2452 TaxID=904376 RepID=A0A951Q749_9CYAN|nr:nucleotidyltransferase domain-containing protein [Drouetiella hepatica Uher 2000/2452]